MLSKLIKTIIAIISLYLTMLYLVDITRIRQQAAINFIGDVIVNLYKDFNANNKFPLTVNISKEQMSKYSIANYNYKLVANDDFELVLYFKNNIIKDSIIRSNKDGVFVLKGNEWYQDLRVVHMKDKKSVEIKR